MFQKNLWDQLWKSLGQAEMVNMTSAVNGYSRLEFVVPARGLIGFRNEFMTDTKGNGIMNHVFEGYGPYKGDIPSRSRGSIVAFETGDAIAYGLFNAQDKGQLFIGLWCASIPRNGCRCLWKSRRLRYKCM